MQRLFGLPQKLRSEMLEHSSGRILLRAIDAYHLHGCMFMSAALSFFVVISVIPLSYLALVILTQIVGPSVDVYNSLEAVLRPYLLPDAIVMLRDRVSKISAEGVNIAGAGVGILSFLWAGIRFYEILQVMLTRAWGGSQVRPFLRSKLVSIVLFIAAGALTGLFIMLGTALRNLENLVPAFLGFRLDGLWLFITDSVPALAACFVVFLIYQYLPTRRVPWKVSLAVAVPVGLFWYLSKFLFTRLVLAGGVFTTLYGPMAGFIVLMIWIYFSSSIVLFGAEMGASIQQELHPEEFNSHNGVQQEAVDTRLGV
ncbi:YihY/virulence factor BrkB family protein [bacterium]|nr:YihY/virulence factor BrkB family protein [bacterium]